MEYLNGARYLSDITPTSDLKRSACAPQAGRPGRTFCTRAPVVIHGSIPTLDWKHIVPLDALYSPTFPQVTKCALTL